MDEVQRIRQVYQGRSPAVDSAQYLRTNPVALFGVHQKEREILAALRKEQFTPFAGKKILDIGCGAGSWLLTFELWGFSRQDLAGIDLKDDSIDIARRRLSSYRDEHGCLLSPGADLVCGDAARLPWENNSFDLVLQSTALTSILDAAMKRAVAMEMMRVVKPDGIILWYDFLYHNPRNPNVRGIGRREISSLFPGAKVRLRRITLAPPLSRRIVPWTWLGAMIIERFGLLNTHYLGVIRKRG